jgi:tRNA dimethylallyltransferase
LPEPDLTRPLVISIIGPTASGKTDLAVELVRRFSMDIVSVDSAMIYRGMDIGTAKPTAQVLAEAPHRLIDILDPAEVYSAARFREDALAEIEDIHRQSRVPLLVGGTMLYFRALEQGLSPLPAADEGVRHAIMAEARLVGWPAMHRQLVALDPGSAARIHPSDPQRIQRALEIYRLTGRSRSELWQSSGKSLPFENLSLMIAPADRSVLHQRIARRFNMMLEAGLVAEVQHLFARADLTLESPSMRAVGYRQVWEYLCGTLNAEQMRYRGIVATRQLAKRQLTWMRRREAGIWLESTDPKLLQRVLSCLGEAGVAASGD